MAPQAALTALYRLGILSHGIKSIGVALVQEGIIPHPSY